LNKFILIFLILLQANVSFAGALALQALALAPNAGGQESYSIKYHRGDYEWSLFSTNYLITNGNPLTGLTLARRFDICKSNCWVQGFVQPGFGFTQIGAHFDLTWGTVIGYAVRIDLTTQLYTGHSRLLSWSYPLWVGVSFPF
jgi:hypothetical protein